MAKAPKSKTATVSQKDDPEQSKAFVKKAREIEADENKSKADALIGVMAKKPPKPHKPQ